jgi:peptidoglycan L-alanyl-D-glutamate endopeptidase CwlK
MDAISTTRLAEVHPVLAAKIYQMADLLAKESITIRVVQGLRSWQEQQALYDQGRTQAGKIVTNAPPGHSWHQYGLAVDLVPLSGMGPDWNAQHPVWQRLVETGTSLGLQSGAQWRSFPDYPHFQLVGSWPVAPNDEVRTLFISAGIKEVWKQAGLEVMA